MAQATRVAVGDHVDYTPGSAVDSGDVVVQDNTPLPAELDIAANELGALATSGLFDVVKKEESISAGDWLYWDADGDPYGGTAGSGAVTATSADGVCMGYAIADAASTASTVRINLLPLPSDNVTVTENANFSKTITDPGDAGAIPVTDSGTVSLVTEEGAETRTLADPTAAGQVMNLGFKTDGGDCVITAATGVNQAGNTSLTFADAGDNLVLIAIESGANLVWRIVANDGVALA